ncbi:MAG: DUF962 domain-containing protein [Pseudomonadota bacterium]
MSEKMDSYAAFWPHYLREHAQPGTRRLHYFGTALGIVLLIVAIVFQIWWLVLVAIVSGYLFAWVGHMTIERNRPATFTYPFWSLISDLRMFYLWCRGRMQGELRRAGVED